MGVQGVDDRHARGRGGELRRFRVQLAVPETQVVADGPYGWGLGATETMGPVDG
jgi:hypothetical protein